MKVTITVIDLLKVDENDPRDFTQVSREECQELVKSGAAVDYDLPTFEYKYNAEELGYDTIIRIFVEC